MDAVALRAGLVRMALVMDTRWNSKIAMPANFLKNQRFLSAIDKLKFDSCI